MNKLKELAANYGVTVGELTDIMGYSRPALYAKHVKSHDKHRMTAAIRLLEQDNLTRLAADREQAQIDFEWRRQVIEDIERFLL